MVILILLVQAFVQTAVADWQWKAAAQVNLYSAPSTQSPVIKSLEEGEIVLITKLQKVNEGWVSFTLNDDEQRTKVYVEKKALGAGEIRNLKKSQETNTLNITNPFLKNLGVGLTINQTLRGPISKDAGSNQTVEYGPQYGIAFFPTVHYEIPTSKGNTYRFFVAYRINKSQGQSGIKQNGILTSQELVTQSISFVSIGILIRERSTPQSNYWWGYGIEIAKGVEGKQEYTDGTFVDLKDNLPTNFYLQGSLGYQAYPARNSQWIPEIKAGVVINNKPIAVNGEIIFNWVKAF
ncbi:MAG: hypothetical protein A4S09_16260 [Proteobacteria bacterium SG_bin7]|nr:MAG: hypothetical protein A4S09_16260 [Proteobacteria bacterium SG_bin7]